MLILRLLLLRSSSQVNLQKRDFGDMEVIGQFNMGFILAKDRR